MTNNSTNNSTDRRNKVTRTFTINNYKFATIDLETLTVKVNQVSYIAGSNDDKAFLKSNPQIIEATYTEALYAMDYVTFMKKARVLLPDGRRNMVTRTFTINNYKVATIDLETLTVKVVNVEYIAGSNDEKAFLKSNPTIIDTITVERLVGVSYDVFLKYAEVIG